MDSKSTLLTVIEDAADHDIERINEFEKMKLDRSDYDPKISKLLPPSISSSDESEMDDDSDSDDNLDIITKSDSGDPNQTLEVADINKDEKKESNEKEEFRGRPSSCVFVASLASSKTDDELSISVTKHFEQVSIKI